MRPTVPTHQHSVLLNETFRPKLATRAGPRMKALDIDAVAYPFDFVGPYADGPHQPMGQVFAYRRITGGERIDGFSQEVVFAIASIQFVNVATMLTMNASRDSSGRRYDQVFERSNISRMYDHRPEFF
jgi:hypothetical protein